MQNCLSTTTAGPTTTSPTEGFFDYGPCDSGDKSCLLFPPGCGDFRNCSVVASWKLLGSDAIEIESQCLYTEASGLSYVGAGITADNTTENSATFVLSGNYTLGDYSAESLVSELISGIFLLMVLLMRFLCFSSTQFVCGFPPVFFFPRLYCHPCTLPSV